MASYELIGSYSTVQVLSPTLTNEIEYCTIRTQPSLVIASKPVQRTVFDAGQAGEELSIFAEAIEQIMSSDHAIVSATGSQVLDPASGLLDDVVIFTVAYPDATTGNAVTAEAVVPVGLLDFSDGQIGSVLLQQVDAILNAVYANLRDAAGG